MWDMCLFLLILNFNLQTNEQVQQKTRWCMFWWEVSVGGLWRQLGWNLGGEICGEGMFHDIEALWVDSVTSSAIRLNT